MAPGGGFRGHVGQFDGDGPRRGHQLSSFDQRRQYPKEEQAEHGQAAYQRMGVQIKSSNALSGSSNPAKAR